MSISCFPLDNFTFQAELVTIEAVESLDKPEYLYEFISSFRVCLNIVF